MEDFGLEKQRLYIHYLLRDSDTYFRCMNIIKPEFFENSLRSAVKFIIEYTDKHKKLPPKALIVADTGVDYSSPIVESATEKELIELKDWFLEDFEKFCKKQALIKAVFQAAESIEKGLLDGLDKNIREALLISLNKDLGTNYFEDPLARLTNMISKNNMCSTGWKDIDDKLYGGFNRGEVTIFAGNSGMGKSLFLQNLTINWARQKRNVVYITFELSEDLTAARFDAIMTDMGTKDVVKNRESVHHIVTSKIPNFGSIQIKYLSPGSSANDLRAYLKEYEIQTGIKPDAIAVDYLDLMHPNNKKVDPSNLFVKDKYISEELRSLAAELNLLCATASQLNRGAVDEQSHDIADIAGGLSKINTVDNVITIFTSAPMRERGEYRLQFIKTRSSSGVGSIVYLKFNPVSLRIYDMPPGERPGVNVQETASDQLSKLRSRKAKTSEEEEYDPETGEIKNYDPPKQTKANVLDLIKKVQSL
jgi:KaiC/GvpD/RAD55 family RecA-like ATPase